MTFKSSAQEFLSYQRLAVVGVSRTKQNAANGIYKSLRSRGYDVVAVHPQAETVEGDVCYPSLGALPAPVDGVIIGTNPAVTNEVVRECSAAGIKRVWMHDNTFAPSSVSDEAVQYCHDHDIDVIAGGCPLMFMDIGHKCMRWTLGLMGRLPE